MATVPAYVIQRNADRALKKTCSAHISNSALEEINIYLDHVLKYFVDYCPVEPLADLTTPHCIMKTLINNPKVLKACENHAITKCCEVASGLSLNSTAITPKLDKSLVVKGKEFQFRQNLLEQLRFFCSQYTSYGIRGNIPNNHSSAPQFSLLVGVFIAQVLEFVINTIMSEISVFSLEHDETKISNNQLTYIITSNALLIKIADQIKFFDRSNELFVEKPIHTNNSSQSNNHLYSLKSTDSSDSVHSFTSSIYHSESQYEKPHEPKWSILKGLRMFKESINSVSHCSKSKLLQTTKDSSIKTFNYNSQFNYSESDFQSYNTSPQMIPTPLRRPKINEVQFKKTSTN